MARAAPGSTAGAAAGVKEDPGSTLSAMACSAADWPAHQQLLHFVVVMGELDQQLAEGHIPPCDGTPHQAAPGCAAPVFPGNRPGFPVDGRHPGAPMDRPPQALPQRALRPHWPPVPAPRPAGHRPTPRARLRAQDAPPARPTVLIGNMPALNNNSRLMCGWGGVMQILAPGQGTVMVPYGAPGVTLPKAQTPRGRSRPSCA